MITVLYIEDDAANIELIRRYLSASNCNLIQATDGGSGIAMAVEYMPDVILLDIYLPDISGLDVVDQLKSMQELAHIPVVVLTTDDSLELKNECYAHNVAQVLHKPVRPQDLLDVIHHVA